MNSILNIIGYRFIAMPDLEATREELLTLLTPLEVLGTILIAKEGVNVALAGDPNRIREAISQLQQSRRLASVFNEFWFKESWSEFSPFAKLKVRIRPEIIAFDGGQTEPAKNPAPNISPEQVKQWLDDGVEFLLLDTRNNYEVESGTFANAQQLNIDTFREFPTAARSLAERFKPYRKLPVVTFCTGGVRCEKAAPWLSENGFDQVYQIEGGILNYFDRCGGAHWQGDCFVFDDRVTIDTNQNPTGSLICRGCHRAVPAGEVIIEAGLMPHEVLKCEACAPKSASEA